MVTSHKSIQRSENILNLALRAGSVRRTQVLPDIGCGDGAAAGLPLSTERTPLIPLPKIHCTAEPVAHSSSACPRPSYFRATGRDTDLALPRMMTEAGRRRLQCTVRSYDRLPPEVRHPSLSVFKHGVLGFVYLGMNGLVRHLSLSAFKHQVLGFVYLGMNGLSH